MLETTKSPIAEKWGSALDAGFVVIPSALLLKQRYLELNDSEMIVVMHMLLAWREKDRLPFPRPTTLAKRMGVGTRTVQRHLASVIRKGLIAKVLDPVTGMQTYDLGVLVEKLKLAAPLIASQHRQNEEIRI